MFYFNTLNLNQISGGNQVKQGDFGSTFTYKLADEKNQELNAFDQKTAYVNLVLNNNIIFTTTVIVDDSTVTFNIDKAIPTGLYFLEIKIDRYIFPSDRQTIILVTSGSVAYDLKELVPNYDTNMTITGILSDLSQKGIDISGLKNRLEDFESTNNSRLLSVESGLATTTQNMEGIDRVFSDRTFATLAELQAAYPNGTNQRHIVAEDGKWYWWDGTIWKAGIVAQAVGIPEKGIGTNALKDATVIASKTDFATQRVLFMADKLDYKTVGIGSFKDYRVNDISISENVQYKITAESAKMLGLQTVHVSSYREDGTEIQNKIFDIPSAGSAIRGYSYTGVTPLGTFKIQIRFFFVSNASAAGETITSGMNLWIKGVVVTAGDITLRDNVKIRNKNMSDDSVDNRLLSMYNKRFFLVPFSYVNLPNFDTKNGMLTLYKGTALYNGDTKELVAETVADVLLSTTSTSQINYLVYHTGLKQFQLLPSYTQLSNLIPLGAIERRSGRGALACQYTIDSHASNLGVVPFESLDETTRNYIQQGGSFLPLGEMDATRAKIADTYSHDRFSYIMLTDLHLDYKENKYIEHAKKQVGVAVDLANSTDVDMLVLGGDYTSGGNPQKEETNSYVRMVTDELKKCRKPVLMLRGNHDNNANNNQPIEEQISTSELYATTQAIFRQDNFVYDPQVVDGMYFYVDFPRKKTRAIVLDTYNPEYAPRQLEWFYESALSQKEEGWRYVILTHVPLNIRYNSGGATWAATNGEDYERLISALNNRHSYQSKTVPITDFGDYQSQVISVSFGHTHASYAEYREDLRSFCISTGCGAILGSSPFNTLTNDDGSTNRLVGQKDNDPTKYLFDVLSCTEEKLNRIRFGNGSDKEVLA